MAENDKKTLRKYGEVIFWIILVTLILNIAGNWLEANNCYFNFEIFSGYIPVIVTVVTLYLGYRLYLDTKITDNTRSLYEKELENVKFEEEVFYQYYTSITDLPTVMTRETSKPIDNFLNISNQFIEIFKLGDQLDILTDISSYKIKGDCLECEHHTDSFPDMIKAKKKLFEIRYELLDSIRNEIIGLSIFVKEYNTEIEEIRKQHSIIEDFDNRLSECQNKLYKANEQTQNNIIDIINNRVKNDFFQTYKIYRGIQKQYIEGKKNNKYLTNKECEKCEFARLTYKDIEKITGELQELRNLGDLDN